MKTLIIDSHKSSDDSDQQSLHWQNARIVANHLGADLIWSYPSVNNNIKTGYDVIIFCHSSQYAFISDEWLHLNKNAKLFYMMNDYSIGEPMLLWKFAKEGRHYDVIANHDREYSAKIVKKYTDRWLTTNLNSIITNRDLYLNFKSEGLFGDIYRNKACVYYGTFRRGRTESIRRLLSGCVISTHQKNRPLFKRNGSGNNFTDRLDLNGGDLSRYMASLYIEDDATHTDYSCLANRFYEAINSRTHMLYDRRCMNTYERSGYLRYIPEQLMVENVDDIKKALQYAAHYEFDDRLIVEAENERTNCLNEIVRFVAS